MILISQLNTLESAGLVRLVAAQPELEYLFRHALVQDAAYQSLLKNDRRQLHASVGDALEQLFPNQADELAATLAYHYKEAEAPEKAAHYFRRAGDRARSGYANAEAIAFYQAAINQVEKLSGAPVGDLVGAWLEILKQLYEAAGDLLELTGQHDAAKDGFSRALSLAAAADRILRARLLRKIGYAWMIQAQQERALAIFDEAENTLGSEPAAPESAWRQEWIQIQLDRMWLRYVRNEVAELTALIEKTQPALDQFGLPAQSFGFYRGLTLGAFRRERYRLSEQTLAHAKAGLTHAHASNNLSSIAEGLFMVGLCHALRGEWAEGEENLLAAAQLAERIGNVATLARTLTHMINMYRRRGQIAKVIEFNHQLLKAAESGQLREYIAAGMANAAWLAWHEGDLSEARRLAEAAFEIWRQSAILYPFQWAALWPLLTLAVTQDRLPDAIDYARQLIAPVQLRLPDEITKALEDAVREGEQDQAEKAREHLEQAVGMARETGYL